MRDDPWQSFDRRRLAVFAAAFAGVFLLGGIIGAIEFLELRAWRTNPVIAAVERATAKSPDLRTEFDAKFREARIRVAETRRKAETAELAVFQFLNQEFAERPEQQTRPVEPHRTEARHADVQPAPRPNPQWLNLNGNLASLERKRSELLEKMTTAHPAVQSLDAQIGQVEDQIAAIPANLPLESGSSPRSQSTAETADESDGRIVNSPRTTTVQSNTEQSAVELQRTYREMLLAAGHARDAYRKALNRENLAFTESHSVQNVQLAANDGTIKLLEQEPESVDTTLFGRNVPVGAIVILAVVSLIAGLATARRVRPRRLTYISAEEIEAALGLPTLGRIGARSDKPDKHAA